LLNLSGQTALNVNATQDGGAYVSISNNLISVEGVNIHYETNYIISPGKSPAPVNGIMSIDIDLADHSDVYAASVGTSITVDLGLYDPVYGPAANLLHLRRRFELPPGSPPNSGPPASGGHAA
jgi:hypothetical protein